MFFQKVISQAAVGTPFPDDPVVLARGSTRLLFSFGIVAFAYSCHTNLVPLADEQRGSSPRMLGASLHAAILVCTLLYLVVSACGYVYLREHTPSNYLKFFPASDVVISVFRCVLATSLLFTLPLCVMPCVGALEMLLAPRSWPKLLSLGFLLLAMLAAMFVPNVGIVFSLTGSVASSMTSFIFPPILYARLASIPLRSWKGLPLLSCAVFGVVMAVFGVVAAALDIAKVNV